MIIPVLLMFVPPSPGVFTRSSALPKAVSGVQIEIPGSPSIVDNLNYALVDNWDGDGAPAVSTGVFTIAKDILRKYSRNKDPIDYGPNSDGSLSFVWEDAFKNHVFLEIGKDKAIHLFYKTERLGVWEGVFKAEDTRIQTRILSALSEIGGYQNFIASISAPSSALLLISSIVRKS